MEFFGSERVVLAGRYGQKTDQQYDKPQGKPPSLFDDRGWCLSVVFSETTTPLIVLRGSLVADDWRG